MKDLKLLSIWKTILKKYKIIVSSHVTQTWQWHQNHSLQFLRKDSMWQITIREIHEYYHKYAPSFSVLFGIASQNKFSA